MKLKQLKNNIVILALLAIVSSCNLSNNSAQTSSNESPWESDSAWYLSNTPKSNDKIDLLFFYNGH